jgi:hypothetical protein
VTAALPPAERATKFGSGRLRLSRPGLVAALVYEGVVVAVAIGGAVTHEPGYWLALLVLTLFCGIAAFVGLYIFYGLLVELGAVLGAHMAASGDGPLWFVIPDGIIDVALFAAAGAANVVLVSRLARRVSQRRRGRTGQPAG